MSAGPSVRRAISTVAGADNNLELDLHREHAAIGALHDQIDLVLARPSPQVPDRCLGSLGEGPHTERDERLKQVAEQRSVPGHRRAHRSALKQTVRSHAKRPRRQCGIDELVLGRRSKASA